MSISSAQSSVAKRPYRLGQRALKQEETRRRIVQAAVDLHSTLGPARTTVAQIAEQAGVQRHTYYAHFPEERDLFLACSGMALERDPLPPVDQWLDIPAGAERLRLGLEQIYGWYSRNAQQAACVLRDAEYHPLTREMVELRMKPVFDQAGQLLAESLSPQSVALLPLALDFACWRVLAQQHSPNVAAALMSDAILAVDSGGGKDPGAEEGR